METVTLLRCHMCLDLKPFLLLLKNKKSFAVGAPEKHRGGKPLESVIQLKTSACLPHHPQYHHKWGSHSCSSDQKGGNGSVWPARPTEVERMCCPAGEHVNTEGGKKTSYKQLFPLSWSPSSYTWRDGGGRGSRGRVGRMRRRGKKAAEGWKKYWMVGGKGGGEEESGWPEKNKNKTKS